MTLRNKIIRRALAAAILCAAMLHLSRAARAQDAQPAIGIAPAIASLEVGQTLTISVQIDTAGTGIRGGAAVLQFDPSVFQVANGAAGIVLDPNSTFQLTPPPVLANGQVQLPFLAPSFEQIPFVGGIAYVQFTAIGPSEGTAISLAAGISRFSPQSGTPLLLGAGQYVVSGDATPTEVPQDTPESTPDETVDTPDNSNPQATPVPVGGVGSGVSGSGTERNALANTNQNKTGSPANSGGKAGTGTTGAAPQGTNPATGAAGKPSQQAGGDKPATQPTAAADPNAPKPADPNAPPVAAADPNAATPAETEIASLPPNAQPEETPNLALEFERRWSPGLVKRLGGRFNWNYYE